MGTLGTLPVRASWGCVSLGLGSGNGASLGLGTEGVSPCLGQGLHGCLPCPGAWWPGWPWQSMVTPAWQGHPWVVAGTAGSARQHRIPAPGGAIRLPASLAAGPTINLPGCPLEFAARGPMGRRGGPAGRRLGWQGGGRGRRTARHKSESGPGEQDDGWGWAQSSWPRHRPWPCCGDCGWGHGLSWGWGQEWA